MGWAAGVDLRDNLEKESPALGGWLSRCQMNSFLLVVGSQPLSYLTYWMYSCWPFPLWNISSAWPQARDTHFLPISLTLPSQSPLFFSFSSFCSLNTIYKLYSQTCISSPDPFPKLQICKSLITHIPFCWHVLQIISLGFPVYCYHQPSLGAHLLLVLLQ